MTDNTQHDRGVLASLNRSSALQPDWRRGLRSPLAQRFAVLTVLSSSVIALLMTAFQLYVDYKTDRIALDSAVNKIQKTLIPSLVESIWVLDEVLIQSQLDGMVQIEGIEHARIMNADDLDKAAGDPGVAGAQAKEFPLSRGGAMLGSLQVAVSYDAIEQRIFNRAALILGSNFVKAAIVSVIIMLIYHYLIGRHVTRLAGFAASRDPSDEPVPIDLGRRLAGRDAAFDELAMLQSAMNAWSRENHDHLKRAEDANAELKENHHELQATHTALKLRSAELLAANTQLEGANREQAEFTYAISHDMKAPANTMGMLLNEVLEHGRMDEEDAELLSMMAATNRRMKALVDDVLGYSRLVGGEEIAEPVDLDALLSSIRVDLAADIMAASATIEIGDLPDIKGYPAQLRLLFQNLIANAVKFRAPEKSPVIEVTAEIPSDDVVEIIVSDNGIGIPEEHREGVFGLFKRLHTRSEYEGTGLGLGICRRVMHNHAGQISACDSPAGGTSFRLSFPAGV
ncbi:MAG: ATP-binding protein [Pseudomonadota bacterium]